MLADLSLVNIYDTRIILTVAMRQRHKEVKSLGQSCSAVEWYDQGWVPDFVDVKGQFRHSVRVSFPHD